MKSTLSGGLLNNVQKYNKSKHNNNNNNNKTSRLAVLSPLKG